MGFFNKKWVVSMLSRHYTCSECGGEMEFEDEWEDTLVCPHCGHSVDIDEYGCEDDDEYENLYPTKEEVLGIEDDDESDD